MSNNATYIINQNRVYDGLIKELRTVSKLPIEEQQSAFSALIHKIQKNKQGSEQKEFEIKFKKTHENFYKKMKEAYPQLTKKDLDLCAFLNLNMSTKEIAALTNQSTRAIEVSRSRLRKKMDISGGINLSEFIRNIRF
jgi:deoxyadenosine/deoxycytidine kinase